MKPWMKRVGIGLIAIAVVVVAAKTTIELLDRTDPVDPAALAATVPSTSPDPEGPEGLAVGVWAFNASGTEYVDLLGGPLHTFPDTVAQSVTDTACGQSVKVMLFEQRHDTLDLCLDDWGRLVFERFETRHEFVGIADVTVTEGCEPIPVWWEGMVDAPSETVSTQCQAHGDMSGDVSAVVSHEVLGPATVTVDGQPIDAVRVRLTSVVGAPTDPTHGTYAGEFWFGADDPMILRRTLDADVSASTPVGNISFKETFDITAKSLDPTAPNGEG